MAEQCYESRVGRPIALQTVQNVLSIALKLADDLCGIWCRSWGHGDEMDRALAMLRHASTVADRYDEIPPSVAVGIMILQSRFHQERLFRKGRKIDCEQALLLAEEICKRDPPNLEAMVRQAYTRHYQYCMTGQRQLLDQAIEILNEVVFACTSTTRELVDALIVAALCLKDRAELDASMSDLDVMIELLRFGINIKDVSGDGQSLLRLILSEGLALRYDVTELGNDLDEAEKLIKECEDLPMHVRHSVYQKSVTGWVSFVRFKKFVQHKDIVSSAKAYTDSLIDVGKESARPAPMAVWTSVKVAQVMREGYHREPAPLMLFGAHSIAERVTSQALAYCKDWGSSHSMIDLHQTLGETQRSRWQAYQSVDILDDAIYHFRKSVQLSNPRDARFGVRATRLSAALRVRFLSSYASSFQKSGDRDEASYWIGQLVKSSRPFKPAEMRECLMEIGDIIQDLHCGPWTAPLLDRAMAHYTHAETFEQSNFAECVGLWRRMAQALIDKGNITRMNEFYESAESYMNKIETLSTQRGYRATGHMPLLARLHEAKYNLLGLTADARKAVEVNYKIFHNSRYEANTKLKAARQYTILIARLVSKTDQSSKLILDELEKSDFLSSKLDDARLATIDYMLQLVSDGSNRTQQLSAIRREALTPLLCLWYAKWAKKSAFELVRLYERGRSVLWDRLINSKTQIDLLQEKHEELATRYRNLRRLIENPKEPDPRLSTLPQDTYQTAAELDDLIKQIQKQPGFEDFLLLPLSQAEMQGFASQGPIIYLIYGPGKAPGFALSISSGSISKIELPNFTEDFCRKQHSQLKLVFASHGDTPEEMDNILGEVLKMLWLNAAKPVLQALNLLHSGQHITCLPRVWWITSNWVSRLPIHAAGDHKLAVNTGQPESVMDYVISSYSPTLRALNYSRERLEQLTLNRSSDLNSRNATLVAMQETPDWPKLSHSFAEVKNIQAILEPDIKPTLLLSPNVTRKKVILNLRECTIAHLACHGEADPHDPLRSKLLLQDWGPKPLRVGFLMRMEMTQCQLAYLSACQTAVNEDDQLIEEGIHLSGAFQMAGVPNTIATSWEILDEEAVDVAVGFYKGLRDESGAFDVSRCARSLHATILEMRNRGSSPYIWGSYVHFGA